MVLSLRAFSLYCPGTHLKEAILKIKYGLKTAKHGQNHFSIPCSEMTAKSFWLISPTLVSYKPTAQKPLAPVVIQPGILMLSATSPAVVCALLYIQVISNDKTLPIPLEQKHKPNPISFVIKHSVWKKHLKSCHMYGYSFIYSYIMLLIYGIIVTYFFVLNDDNWCSLCKLVNLLSFSVEDLDLTYHL